MPLPDPVIAALAADVRAGLGGPGRKRLSPAWLYDDVGSALFEAICRLPEYGVTRADLRLLERHAADLAKHTREPLGVVELGPGGGRKSRLVLEPLAARGPIVYWPVEMSLAALAALGAELQALPQVQTTPLPLSYLEGLAVAVSERKPGQHILVLFLGGSIGNFDREEAARFTAQVRAALLPGDLFLLGADLDKDVNTLVTAYDDPAGVTAAFNRNLLARLNRDLGADFDLRCFAHAARWDAVERRVEMHLCSLVAQTVRIPGAGIEVAFAAGETIWTESSYRFGAEELRKLGGDAGFRVAAQWIDPQWAFAETLFVAGTQGQVPTGSI